MTPHRDALLTVANAALAFDYHGPKSIRIHAAGIEPRIHGEHYDLTMTGVV